MGTECQGRWTILEMGVVTAAQCHRTAHLVIKMATFMLSFTINLKKTMANYVIGKAYGTAAPWGDAPWGVAPYSLWWLHSSQVTFHTWRSEVRPGGVPTAPRPDRLVPRRGGRRLSPGAHAAGEVTFPTGCERAPGVPGGWPGPLPPARRHARREVFLKGAGGTEDFVTAPGTVCPRGCAPPGLCAPRAGHSPPGLVSPGAVRQAQDVRSPPVLPGTAAPRSSRLPPATRTPATGLGPPTRDAARGFAVTGSAGPAAQARTLCPGAGRASVVGRSSQVLCGGSSRWGRRRTV